MAEYKIVGYTWDSALKHGYVHSSGYASHSAEKFEAPAAAEDLTRYARDGWRVVNSWRTDKGTIWFVLER
jgi:hypothetical protein